ncbi:MAG: S8 family serine peptidase [Anaerolineae bacterium]
MQTRLKLAAALAIGLALLLLAGPAAAGPTAPPPPTDPALLTKIDPRLLKQLTTGGADRANIIVEMKAQADLRPALALADERLRRRAIVASLQSLAEESQAGVRLELDKAAQAGHVSDIRPLWITNAVAAQTGLETVLALAARDDVRLVRLDNKNYLQAPALLWRLKIPDLQSLISNAEWGVARIRADQVWAAFGIDGAGVVVANIDTGVDYLHPALRTSYRGYAGGTLPDQHNGNWHDSIGNEALYPVDSHGHGSHTMGTIVGEGGIGVAPGARWIAVRAFNNQFGLDSWLHDAFQWLLAPDGDPLLAPDVVNNSWSNSVPSLTTFENDIQLLTQAGILPVFAAGNAGPSEGSVGSPASLDTAFAVGALDEDDEVAAFSGRGPSPWDSTKPDLSAPGVNVRSAIPGGGYAALDGTSMAAPHVVGAAALLLEADPSLTPDQLKALLTGTAMPLSSPVPNNDSGYGRVDAFAAVAQSLQAGAVTGLVADANSGAPIAGATVALTPHGGGATILTTTDENGAYTRHLAATTYDATASAFGYNPQNAFGLTVTDQVTLTQNFSLSPLPVGTLSGAVTEAGSGLPLSATITIDNTPLTASTHPATGAYSLLVPAGVYSLTVGSPGHKVAHRPGVTVPGGSSATEDFSLEPAPTLLLVDSGRWYYDSQAAFYRRALDDLNLYYDTLTIKNPSTDVPISSTLNLYDIVVWSAPADSPGYVGADQALVGYLAQRGNLILSGRDVAFFDGGGFPFLEIQYFSPNLKVRWKSDNAGSNTITGEAGDIFEGLSLTITGGEGADNQLDPDLVSLTDPSATAPLLRYDTAEVAGHRAETCLGHRAVFFPFGLEGIDSHLSRAEVLSRTIAWLTRPPADAGLEFGPSSELKVGDFGQVVTHTVQLRNTAGISGTDTYLLTVSGDDWSTSFPYTQETLATCQSRVLTFTVRVPAWADWNDSDTLVITAQSTVSPTLSLSATRTTKAPAPVLLVDDDRWFDYQDDYRQALEAGNIPYDVWSTNNDVTKTVPTLADLQKYPVVLWYTGFDWYDPVTTDEETMLAAYLDGGGRLFLASQDYFYNLPEHKASQFANTYLGVLAHTEDVTSTAMTGVDGNPLGSGLGPYAFDFPPSYNNWTDVITVTDDSNIATRAQDRRPNGATFLGTGDETWHTAFFGYGLEVLDDAARARAVQRIVGWLSWLGASTLTPSATLAADGDTLVYTATIRNDGRNALSSAAFTATFPSTLNYVPGSVTGGAVESNGALVWTGPLAKNESRTFTYRAGLNGAIPPGTVLTQTALFGDNDHGLLFDAVARTRANVPDLTDSNLSVTPDSVGKGEVLTYTLTLYNNGVADAPLVTVTTTLSDALVLVGNVEASQGNSQVVGQAITWTLALAKGETASLVYRAKLTEILYPFQVRATVLADDGFIADNEWIAVTPVEPYTIHFPLIFIP